MTVHDLCAIKGPEYFALSYSWHPEGPKKSIRVNGVVFRIGFNFWRFLRRLKQLNKTGYLWADALCINQGDTIEKSKQVSMMGQIYKSASEVLVWLGEEHRASGLVMDLANQACKSWEPGEDTMKQWKALMEICKRRYWTRRWIIQELLALPHDRVMIYCGFKFTSFQRLVSMSLLAYHQWGHAHTHKKNMVFENGNLRYCGLDVKVTAMGDLATTTGKGDNLFDLLRRFSGWSCKDKKDQVYALLSLADDTKVDGCPLKPDYTIDIRVLISDIMVFYGSCSREKLRDLMLYLLPQGQNHIPYEEWAIEWPPSSSIRLKN